MIIRGAKVFSCGRFAVTDLKAEGTKICLMGPEAAKEAAGEEIIDREGCKIIPGLVDIHTHGRIGYDFTTASEEEIHIMLEDYLHAGVTSVLATVMTNDKSIMLAAFERLGKIIEEQRAESGITKNGRAEASILGINLEGVWLSPKKRGAHLEEYLELPSIELYDAFYRASGGNIRLATIAPELEGAPELILLNKDKTHFSLGHSEASYEEALGAVEAGADHATHLFNAMPPLGHRAPGLAGAALDKGLFTEIICDGLHVHPAIIRMVFEINAPHTVLISDSIAPAGLADGTYISGGQQVTAQNGKILTPDGTIAGSGISLYEGLKRCVTEFGVDENAAIMAASSNAAGSVGLRETAGELRTGAVADMIVTDYEYNIIEIYKNGIRVKTD